MPLAQPALSDSAVAAPAATAPAHAPTLVDALWLAARLDDVRVIDTRRSGDYLGGHIPGAVSFALDSLLVEDTSQAALERLARAAQSALAARGIGPDDHIVLTDDGDCSAAVGALVCELAGMRSVSVLAPGIGAWRQRGHPLASVPASPAAVEPGTWDDIQPFLAGLVSFEQLGTAVTQRTALIMDVRSQLEHEGIVGAPCCPRRGAIPESTHLEWTAFFDESGAPHRPDRVRAVAAHVGLTPADTVLLACHAGHRAALAGLVLRAAGFAHARVSLGSWHEWSSRTAG